ncbi:MAG: glycosyltransferase family 39 protein [Acidobacteriota bacterium]
MRNSNFPKALWLVVIVGFVVLYFFGLNFIPLLGPDEPRYSQIAREMFERGDWVTPTLGGYNWFEKPALLYWAQHLAYNIFGVSEFSARFFSAIFGLGVVFAIWRLCLRVETLVQKKGFYSQNSNGLAKYTAIALATSIGLIVFSRGASFDIILTFPVTLSLVCFLTFEIYAPHSRSDRDFQGYVATDLIFLALFYVFIGVALIAKGLIGAVIPFGVVFTYYFFQFRFPQRMVIFSLFWGIPLAVLVASIWYLPMYLTHGYGFIDDFFVQHHFQRYTSNKFQHPQPFYFFWWVLPAMTIPWIPFLLTALWNVRNWRSGIAQIPSDYLRYFALAWMIFPIFFFSFSGSKLPGYILPALPGAMILVGDRIQRFVQRSETNKWLIFGLASGTILTCALLLVFMVKDVASHETVKYLIEKADAEGYQNSKIIHFHTISHNTEFYGAKRVARAEDGKLLRIDGVKELADEIRKEGKPVVVLSLLEHVPQLTESDIVTANVMADNGEMAIVAVNVK